MSIVIKYVLNVVSDDCSICNIIANNFVVTFGVLILQFGYQADRKALAEDDYDDQDTTQVCPCHKYRRVGVHMHLHTFLCSQCETRER